MTPLYLRITTEFSETLVFYLILSCVAIFLLAAAFFLFSYRKKSGGHYRIEMPAMQETVKKPHKEKSTHDLSPEEVAVITAALSYCYAAKPDKTFRVVSFKRTH